MTEFQLALWNRYSADFLAGSRNWVIGQENRVEDAFDPEIWSSYPAIDRQNLGRAVIAVFNDVERRQSLTHLERRGVNGSPNRQLYARIE